MAKLHTTIARLLVGASLVLASQRLGAAEVVWSMVFLPDTQIYTQQAAPIFHAQTQWIVDNKVSRNIQIVLHGGDITNLNTPQQWQIARDAYSTLDGVVPYQLVYGNHDMYPHPPSSRESVLLNDYFSLADNPLNSIVTEMVPGDLSNTYSKFTAPDGREMLTFALEHQPEIETLAWAGGIAEDNLDHTAIVLLHDNLGESENVTENGDPIPGRDYYGDNLWDRLSGQHENIEMVLNGHQLDGDDTDPYGPITAVRQQSVGIHGNKVHEIVFNSQEQPLGGNGYLRIYEFLNDGQTVQVRTYSPTMNAWLTNDRNEFQVQLTPLYSADFNEDSSVDGADFLTLQQGYGTVRGATFAQGDANEDGRIDQIDVRVWQSAYGTNSGSPLQSPLQPPSSAPVPEPASWLLATTLGLLFARRRW
jgi:hypothetical protein